MAGFECLMKAMCRWRCGGGFVIEQQEHVQRKKPDGAIYLTAVLHESDSSVCLRPLIGVIVSSVLK